MRHVRTALADPPTTLTSLAGLPLGLLPILLTLSLVLAGCPEGGVITIDGDEPEADDDDSEAPDDDDDDDTEVYPPCEVEGGPAGDSGLACKDAGGVCALSESSCLEGGGSPFPDGDDTCGDGNYVCCVPPAPSSQSPMCGDWGGSCSTFSACLLTDGSYAPYEVTGGSCEDGNGDLYCCIPEWVCGVRTQICCTDSYAYIPSCECGEFECRSGGELVEEVDCPWVW